MKKFVLTLITLLSLLLWGVRPMMAQEASEAPPMPLWISTDYPSQTVGAGESVTLDIDIETSEPRFIELALEDVPTGWEAAFRGRNRTVQAVAATPDDQGKLDLRVEIPADAEAGTYQFEVVGKNGRLESRLPLSFTVAEKPPANLLFSADLPTLRGKPSTTFRFNVSLKNEGSEEMNFDLSAVAPDGFVTTFKSGGQEVVALPIAADAEERLSVEVDPLFNTIEAAKYPLTIYARGGDLEASLDLTAEVIGEPNLTFSTPNGLLSGDVQAGEETTIPLVLLNTGSAPARNVALSATQPSGWEVTFEPETVPEVAAGEQAEVTAHVKPNDNALAGDYMLTLRARPEDSSNESLEYRATVRTSTLWGVAGIGLIAVAVLVVAGAVMRFGRR